MRSFYYKAKVNNNGEIELTSISFKGKGQSPLIMVIREYWYNNEVVWADCVFSSHNILARLNHKIKVYFKIGGKKC